MLENGKPKEALTQLEEALQMNPNYLEAREYAARSCINLGKDLAHKGQSMEAIDYFVKA